jgi:hypothetical protein
MGDRIEKAEISEDADAAARHMHHRNLGAADAPALLDRQRQDEQEADERAEEQDLETVESAAEKLHQDRHAGEQQGADRDVNRAARIAATRRPARGERRGPGCERRGVKRQDGP